MINNYRSRSFSFRSFKQSRNSTALPNSAIFTPARKKTVSSSPDASYLAISYVSPQKYDTNNPKNNEPTPLQCHVPPSNSYSIRPKRFRSSIFQRGRDPTLQAEESPFLKKQRQRCLYDYFANLARKEEEQEEMVKEERSKAKSILLIRKINKKKEEMVERAKDKMEQQFRNRKQVPIHHTQFHFHKKNNNRTQQSSPHHHTQHADFSKKIHHAVQEILKLRATYSSSQQPPPQKCTIPSEDFHGIIIEGGNFSPPHKPSLPLCSKPSKMPKKQKTKTVGAVDAQEIGPWVRSNNDFQFLF